MMTPNHLDKKNKTLWSFLTLVSLILTGWVQLKTWQNTSLSSILTLVIYGQLSFVLSRLLNTLFNEDKRHYRLAVIFSVGYGLILSILSLLIISSSFSLWDLALVFIGGFTGSFIASNKSRGWWENNAPPSPQVKQAVIALHQGYMNAGEKSPLGKRLFDILFSLISLVVSAPIWLLVILLVWWEDPGPVLFVKNSVGRGGYNFKQLKFRSMVTDAEQETGPISGYEDDERVLFIGKFIRKTALDELPQLINILTGDMSYVGPRPQRTVLVHGYLQSMPEYAARHLVRPGLAGLAQVADSYNISPEEKLAWDLVYIDRVNLWLDFKLAVSAFLLVFVLRWRPGIDAEKTIRRILNVQKPALETSIKTLETH